MLSSFLEQKLFDEEKPVTVEYLRRLLNLTQKQLANLAQIDVKTIKRAENAYNSIRSSSAERVVAALNRELHKRGYLREEKTL